MKVYREWSVTTTHEETLEVEDEEFFNRVEKKPKFKVGDRREVYSGYYEGWGVTIKDIRFYKGDNQHTKPGYQYFINVGLTDMWIPENQLW